MGVFQFKKEQLVKTSIDELWDFISSPKNLKLITPPEMGFMITSEEITDPIHPGMIITYKVKPMLNIPVNWVTEITEVKQKKYFIDEQKVGPYKLWHHQHFLSETNNGVVMKDIVTYSPPLGPLGNIMNKLFISGKLDHIFEHRRKKFNLIFNS